MIRSLGRVALQRDHGGLLTGAVRGLSTGGLKQVLASKIPKMQADVKQIREKHGQKVLGSCTVAQAYGGMRSVKCMTYETSLLDPMEGIRFRGYTIPECQVRGTAKPNEAKEVHVWLKNELAQSRSECVPCGTREINLYPFIELCIS
mmetsp:Transcript_11783/g.48991  ORF Transcript_11783/g.48991 Transcript_11783/m.48991 type:complete len:147 (-) Transcript_11783:986-1426(-)